MFRIIGAAEAAANLLCEFKIAEKKDSKLTNNIKGKVIFVNWIAKANFSGLDLKPGAIKDTKKGMNSSTKSTNANRKIVKRLKILLAKFSASFFQKLPKPLITIDQLKLLKYDNVASGNFKTNFDLGIPSELKFENEVSKYCFMWRKEGQYTKEEYKIEENR